MTTKQPLNEKGFRTTHGKLFTTVTLRGLFRNRALIGETTINFKEKVVTLHHEPILDVATFEATKTGVGRYYYRCEQHCGERAWRKDELEWEVARC